MVRRRNHAMLSYLINLSLQKGVFPEVLKVTIIRPLFKKEDRQNMNFYRALALIPIFSKIYEKVIYNNLYPFLEKFKIFADEQKGFRKNKSIELALFDFLREVVTKVDARTPVSALYMDLTRAFEYVNHEILFKKLYTYGIRGNALELIKSYLTNRSQITQVEYIDMTTKEKLTASSRERKQENGLPQGSITAPPLFLLYINDLPAYIKQRMVLFADDSTAIISKNKDMDYENDINMTLKTIINWLQHNNLHINLDKTKLMQFTQRIGTQNLNITHDGKLIENIVSTKFLGVIIDMHLTWKPHIDYVCKKLNSFSYALYNLSKVTNESTTIVAFRAYVMSSLRYAIIFWGNSTDRLRAFRAQKRCLRSVCKLKQTDSCVDHFKRLRILTFPSLYIYEVSVFVKANFELFNKFGGARTGTFISSDKRKTALFSKSFFGMAPKIYNKLPKLLRDINDVNVFKQKLHEILVDKCYYKLDDYLADIFLN